MPLWCSGSRYLAVDRAPKAVGAWRPEQLPGAALVEGDHRAHVVFSERAVDERGHKHATQALHTVQVCKRLVGKVPMHTCARTHTHVLLNRVTSKKVKTNT